MKIDKKQIGLYATLLIVGGLIGFLISPSGSTSDKGQEKQDTAASESQTWTCSMHPQIKKSEPGDCPICGMELIPMESQDNGLDPTAVSMSSTAMQLAQVRTSVVGRSAAEKAIRLDGKVQADERLLFSQSSHIPGRVEELKVNFTGEWVSKGQLIAYVYSPELVTAQEELFEARKIKDAQPALFAAAKEKLKNWKLTGEQIEKILASDQPIEKFPVLTDVSGYVMKKMVNLGDYIKQGEALYEIADLSRVWIMFDVYESQMTWMKEGMPITYTVASIPGEQFQGKISYIDPVFNAKTRIAQARVIAANPNYKLKPEMFVSGTAQASKPSSSESIIIPKSAVMWTGKRSVVYVMQNTDQGVSFQMRKVTLGPALGESYVIESGLETGEEIAVNGTFSIDAAAQLAGKPSMMSPEGGAAMTGHNHGEGKEDTGKDSSKSSKKAVKINEKAKKALQPLFEQYFNLKTALAADKPEEAKKSGKKMKEALGKVDMKLFERQAHKIWMEHSKSLKEHLQHAEQFKGLKDMREQFIGISEEMIALTEYFNPIDSAVYVQHCPMVDSNKGADWLSQEEEIRNPYFGKSMLSCGEVTKTVK